jgi:hypothetical protein
MSLPSPFNPSDINANLVATQIGPNPTVAANGNVTINSTLFTGNKTIVSTGGNRDLGQGYEV